MKLLVTGGAGFIGSNYIRARLESHPEDEIFNYDKLTYAGNLENLTDIENKPNYHFIKGDICDQDKVFESVKGMDLVVHFAAESHVDRSIMGPAEFIKTNVVGTQMLLEAVSEYGVRFHHVSTDEVFGSLDASDPAFNETTSYDPKSPYSASKAASDHLVRAYIHTYDIKATISNCSNNYGPYQFPEKIIPLFISNLLDGKKVPVYGDGQNIRDWIYVADHVRGVDKVIEKGKIGETYCFGGDSEVTNLELTKKIIELMGKDESSIKFVKDRPGHDKRYAIDFSKAKRELAWEPRVNFEEGLKKTIAWYKDNQQWANRCKSGEYKDYYNSWYGR